MVLLFLLLRNFRKVKICFSLCERHKSTKVVCWKGLKKLSHDKFCMTVIVCRTFKEKVKFVPYKRSITLKICPVQKISYTWYVSLWFCFILANFVVGHQSSYACFVTSIYFFSTLVNSQLPLNQRCSVVAHQLPRWHFHPRSQPVLQPDGQLPLLPLRHGEQQSELPSPPSHPGLSGCDGAAGEWAVFSSQPGQWTVNMDLGSVWE